MPNKYEYHWYFFHLSHTWPRFPERISAPKPMPAVMLMMFLLSFLFPQLALPHQFLPSSETGQVLLVIQQKKIIKQAMSLWGSLVLSTVLASVSLLISHHCNDPIKFFMYNSIMPHLHIALGSPAKVKFPSITIFLTPFTLFCLLSPTFPSGNC